jgi:hypothetical protein
MGTTQSVSVSIDHHRDVGLQGPPELEGPATGLGSSPESSGEMPSKQYIGCCGSGLAASDDGSIAGRRQLIEWALGSGRARRVPDGSIVRRPQWADGNLKVPESSLE